MAAQFVLQPHRAAGVGQVLRRDVRDRGRHIRRDAPRTEHAGDAVVRLHRRRIARDDEKAAALQSRAGGKVEVNVAIDAEAGEVFEVILAVEDFDELEAVGDAGNFCGVIHDFGNHQPCPSRAGPERLKRKRDAADNRSATGHRWLAELRHGGNIGLMAVHSKADEHVRRHHEAGGAELLPGLAVEAAEAGEHTARALEAQPHLRIVHRHGTFAYGSGSGRGAGLELHAAQARGREHRGKDGVGGRFGPSHETGFAVAVREINRFEPRLHIEVADVDAGVESEVIRRPANVAAAPGDVVATRHRGRRARAAERPDVGHGKLRGDERCLAASRDQVGGHRAIPHAVHGERVGSAGNQGRR